MWVSKGRLRILDFDLENRPLSYLGMDWTSAEVTAIAWAWITDAPPNVETLLLLPDGRYARNDAKPCSASEAFSTIRRYIEAADIVTGHYIRKHDLPLLHSAFMENGLAPFKSLLVQDTCKDLVQRKDFSASQENLASMLGLDEAKHHMTQTEWRQANRLTSHGIAAARKRVVDDVLQHIALRAKLIERRLLKPPRAWTP